MIRLVLMLSFAVASTSITAQEQNIVSIIDDLTIKWDKQAEQLETFAGLKYYCTSDKYRTNAIALLDKIHHYDTLLYNVVSDKYANIKDAEAKATLKEILTVETEYTTPNFKAFLQQECDGFNELQETYSQRSGSKYYKEAEKLEKELAKYVESITTRIDLIDEHVHHLDLD